MTTIFLVRHGDFANPENVFYSRLPGFPLSPLGKKQAKKLGEYFSHQQISAIITSPLARCRQTAQYLSRALGLPARTDERLLEVKSPFLGMKYPKYFEILGGNSLYALPRQIAEGEIPEEIATRMKEVALDTVEKFSGKKVILVSHGDPIMILVSSLLGKDIANFKIPREEYLPKAGFYELEFNGQKLAHAILHRSC